jgi:hypothetical protein
LTCFFHRSHYVTSLSSSRRKTTGSGTNGTSNIASGSGNANGGSGGGESGRASSEDLPVASGSGSGSASISNGGMAGEGSKSQVDEDGDGTDKKRVKRRKPRLVDLFSKLLGFCMLTSPPLARPIRPSLTRKHPNLGLPRTIFPKHLRQTDSPRYSPTCFPLIRSSVLRASGGIRLGQR